MRREDLLQFQAEVYFPLVRKELLTIKGADKFIRKVDLLPRKFPSLLPDVFLALLRRYRLLLPSIHDDWRKRTKDGPRSRILVPTDRLKLPRRWKGKEFVLLEFTERGYVLPWAKGDRPGERHRNEFIYEAVKLLRDAGMKEEDALGLCGDAISIFWGWKFDLGDLQTLRKRGARKPKAKLALNI